MFNEVEAGNGQLVTMFGTFVEVGRATFNTNNKEKSTCRIRDDNNVQHNVHLYKGKGRLPDGSNIGQRHQFNLSSFKGTNPNTQQPYTGYSGFWQADARVNQGGRQQATQQPLQAMQSDKPSSVDITQPQAIREYALRAVLSGVDVPLDMIKQYLESSVIYILTGSWNTMPTKTPPIEDDTDFNDAPTDDDLPF